MDVWIRIRSIQGPPQLLAGCPEKKTDGAEKTLVSFISFVFNK